MSFLETPRFSDRIARGMEGGPQFATDLVVMASGEESRNSKWSQARRVYDAAIACRTLADFEEIEAHFHAVRGRAVGFRFKDFGDYQITAANGVLRAVVDGVQVGAAGSGYGVPVYQLQKRYTRGALTHERDITKPVANTVSVRRGGVAVAFGSGAGQIALDTATGLVTFVADQTRTVSTHTVGASHQVVLASALSPNVSVGQRLYLSGITGTAAAVLNGRSHAVTGVSGATVTLGTATTGLTATGGTAALYPQASETLDAAGEFDVPVRFDTDRLRRRIIARNAAGVYLVECDEIPLVEVRR